MKRCLFSNGLVTDYQWTYGGEYICYPCHVLHSDQKAVRTIEATVKTEGIMRKMSGREPRVKKLKKKKCYRKTKVDRRIIGDYIVPEPEDERHLLTFGFSPKVEGLSFRRLKHLHLNLFSYPHS
ncbi:MAG: hypothetical protein Q7S22_00890 [Candidatus Micrarchaeota archaeon]|nr:hypothetical protein [Candidatus Micrarchaeota archaeon]